jgi:hypothetical protein
MQLSGTTIEEVNSSCEIGAFSSLLLLQLMACTIRKNLEEPISIEATIYISSPDRAGSVIMFIGSSTHPAQEKCLNY